VVTDRLDFGARRVGTLKTVRWDGIGPKDIGVDIGEKARAELAGIVKGAKTVVWNGPMGVFEIPQTAEGTRTIAQALAEATKAGAVTIVGGGDSVSAIEQMGLADQVSHVSTGGGASLEFLEGRELPGVVNLNDE
jgi:phosphoglycerate kinase